MHDVDGRQPSSDEAVHPLPGQAVALAAAPERMEPVPADLDAEGIGGPDVAGHGVVGEMTSHHARQPLPLFRDGQVPTLHQLVFDLFQLRPQPLCDGDAPEPEALRSSSSRKCASYRSREPVLVTGELTDWEGHAPDVLQAMKDNVERIKQLGIGAIGD